MSRASHRSLTAIAVCTVALSLGFQGLDSAKAQFKPGNVFVAEQAYKNCRRGDQYGWDRIWEIDPYTGEVRLFAELRDEECGVLSGLAFSPDGCHLRASQFLNSRVVEFDSEGDWTTVLDIENGILGPLGSNNLAYGPLGIFFVVNEAARNIVKFPPDGGAGEVFADRFDGIRGFGCIAFAANGDLFYGNRNFSAYVLRIAPDGVAGVFDPLEDSMWAPDSLVADHRGNLFMVLSNGDFYRYDLFDGGTRTFEGPLLAGYLYHPSTGPVVFDVSETWLMVPVQPNHELVGVHLSTREQQVLAVALNASPAFGVGTAVVPVLRGDMDRDFDLDVADLRSWFRCVTGPHHSQVSLECAILDMQRDFDIDLADFAVFQEVFGDRGPICR